MARKPVPKNRTKKDDPTKRQQEMERLGLEIKEQEWNVSIVGKLVKLAPQIEIISISSSLKDTNLFRANLSGACLLSCDLEYADISEADLSYADLSFANLTGIKGFKEIKDLEQTNLKEVKGLSREDLEYAKSKGAITE